jgi:hypothetical protein
MSNRIGSEKLSEVTKELPVIQNLMNIYTSFRFENLLEREAVLAAFNMSSMDDTNFLNGKPFGYETIFS